jgi:hypothetical protein
MATYTNHYEMTKQQSPERVSVGLLNDNFDIIDGVMFANQEKSEQLADDYNASETYNTGDYVRRENYLYKCNTDNTTGTWDDTKWDRVKVMDEISQGGGGGSSTLAGLNDVNISSPTDGQALVYDNATHKWVNRAGGGGSSTFAGLNDVDVAGVANKDIIRYNSTTQKYEKSSDLTDLELSVSQLSSSVLNIAGDVDALELTVGQMSASTLPYDANTSTKQKIDEVVAGLTGWSTLETLYTDSGFVMKGATNSELKLAIIKLEGTANRPSVSGIATQLATKYKPFLTEPFARVRYGGDMWVNVSGELRLSGMDTSQAWQNGFLMYPTK